MKKINYLIFLLLFSLFVPKVDALTYTMGTQLTNTGGASYEIKVSLKNIVDTDYGIAACSMNIELDGDIELNTKVRTLGGWSMTVENMYLFDTGNPALENTDFILIPVKATGNGVVTISNIKCSDGDTSVSNDNKVINITYNPNTSSGTGSNDNNKGNETVKDSNCDLSDIKLSEGEIDFDPAVVEYSINISNYDNLVVEPVLASDKADYSIDKTSEKVVINVVAEDGSKKAYIIYLKDKVVDEDNNDDVEVVEKKNNYTPIFIVIICVLVLINIFRVVKNMKKG